MTRQTRNKKRKRKTKIYKIYSNNLKLKKPHLINQSNSWNSSLQNLMSKAESMTNKVNQLRNKPFRTFLKVLAAISLDNNASEHTD